VLLLIQLSSEGTEQGGFSAAHFAHQGGGLLPLDGMMETCQGFFHGG
jgi:hypothetical protein